jgi:HEAT repeat protein
LCSRKGINAVRPITRNFAAYVLGMVGADEAADDLAESLEQDEAAEVRFYCVTSLGKLRSRKHLSLLRNTYKMSRQAIEQGMIAKAICRIVGIARFEL